MHLLKVRPVLKLNATVNFPVKPRSVTVTAKAAGFLLFEYRSRWVLSSVIRWAITGARGAEKRA